MIAFGVLSSLIRVTASFVSHRGEKSIYKTADELDENWVVQHAGDGLYIRKSLSIYSW